jgi:serine/threonine protein kinase
MHHDIKSLNVFMDKNMVSKLADFGMGTDVIPSTDMIPSTDVCGTPQWMSPEVLANSFGRETLYDKRCDVFSYGVLSWEIFHCHIPYIAFPSWPGPATTRSYNTGNKPVL